MSVKYEPVIGLEVHAVLETRSKMFCACPVLVSAHSHPNTAVCPICSGMPGSLPVVNEKVVAYAVRVALALNCEIPLQSIFARKSYFYPDIPKGYQISQYEQPLAVKGALKIETSAGEETIGITHVHLEEDTGKLTHINTDGERYSLVDLNRSGMPLLEIVSEPVLHSAEAARAYAFQLRSILKYLGVNSGDLEKGLFRIEPNISLREWGSDELGTRVEIKNLNSFRSLERGIDFEIKRQTELLDQGKEVVQQTLGWDEAQQVTVPQRSKEDAEDYRYFPEPDLPPLLLTKKWLDEMRGSLPELPHERAKRFQEVYQLSVYDAQVLTSSKTVADYYEAVLQADKELSPKTIANWITGNLFAIMKAKSISMDALQSPPEDLARLIQMLEEGEINANTAKGVLEKMLSANLSPDEIVKKEGLTQISDRGQIKILIEQVIKDNPQQVTAYLSGKRNLENYFFGQVMKLASGKADPKAIRQELRQLLASLNQA